jgi:hypothetical protein
MSRRNIPIAVIQPKRLTLASFAVRSARPWSTLLVAYPARICDRRGKAVRS